MFDKAWRCSKNCSHSYRQCIEVHLERFSGNHTECKQSGHIFTQIHKQSRHRAHVEPSHPRSKQRRVQGLHENQLFLLFMQEDSNLTHEVGLDTLIVKSVFSLLDAEIWVKGEEKRGTEVSVRVPMELCKLEGDERGRAAGQFERNMQTICKLKDSLPDVRLENCRPRGALKLKRCTLHRNQRSHRRICWSHKD